MYNVYSITAVPCVYILCIRDVDISKVVRKNTKITDEYIVYNTVYIIPYTPWTAAASVVVSIKRYHVYSIYIYILCRVNISSMFS